MLALEVTKLLGSLQTREEITKECHKSVTAPIFKEDNKSLQEESHNNWFHNYRQRSSTGGE